MKKVKYTFSVYITWESSYQAACVWEWLLVTSVTVWPVRTYRSDYGSTAVRLFLEWNKTEENRIRKGRTEKKKPKVKNE